MRSLLKEVFFETKSGPCKKWFQKGTAFEKSRGLKAIRKSKPRLEMIQELQKNHFNNMVPLSLKRVDFIGQDSIAPPLKNTRVILKSCQNSFSQIRILQLNEDILILSPFQVRISLIFLFSFQIR